MSTFWQPLLFLGNYPILCSPSPPPPNRARIPMPQFIRITEKQCYCGRCAELESKHVKKLTGFILPVYNHDQDRYWVRSDDVLQAIIKTYGKRSKTYKYWKAQFATTSSITFHDGEAVPYTPPTQER